MSHQNNNQSFEFLQKSIEEELSQLETYVQKSLAQIDSIKVKRNESLEELICFLNSEEGKKLDEGLKFSYQSIHIAPFLVKHSIFVSVYSFLEYSLKVVSQYAAYDLNTSIRKVNNFEKLYQYFDFLTTEAGLEREKYKEDWDVLNIYRDIRNSITHHNSTIGKNISLKSLEYLKTHKDINLTDSGSFQFLTNELIFELMTLSKKLLTLILVDYSEFKIKNHHKQ